MEAISKSTLFIISALEKSGSKFELEESSENLGLGNEFSQIRLRGSFDIKGKKIYVRGRVEFHWFALCARCGKGFDTRFEAKFNFLFLPEARDRYDESKGNDLFYYSGSEINFADGIRDTIMLALPIKPLCSADCDGIEY
ncbi:DUF177 domain-containing protein [bacterium]|nr:DUF177 domain-containing protein [bacterium]